MDAHADLIDENGELEMPHEDDLFGDGIVGTEARLEAYVTQERQALENDEMLRKLAKLQRKHNTMQNAMLKGNKIASGYDREVIDLKVIQKQLRKKRKDEETKVIVLEEAHALIRDAMDAVAKGQKALFAYLETEATLRGFQETDIRVLRASLDATLYRRASPLNFKVEVLWRFAATIQEWRGGSREQNLRLALHTYLLLLEQCDPDSHPVHYASLCNTLELCEIELERVTGYKIINRANKDFEFAVPSDPSSSATITHSHTHSRTTRNHAVPHQTADHAERHDADDPLFCVCVCVCVLRSNFNFERPASKK